MTRFQFPVQAFSVPIQEFANEVENMIDHVFPRKAEYAGSDCSTANRSFTPRMDLIESDSTFTVHIDLPGFKSFEVKIELHDEKLTISGLRAEPKLQEGSVLRSRERLFGEFRRLLVLPKGVDSEKIDATFADGVLTINLPKIPVVQPRTIEVRSAS